MRREARWLVVLVAIQLGVWPSGAQAQGSPTIAVEPRVAGPGDAIVVRGQGWDNDCAVVLTFDADEGPRLGAAVPDQGAFMTEVTVPTDAAPGDHRLVATGRLFGDVDTQPAACGELSGTRSAATLEVRAPETTELVLSHDQVEFGAVSVGDEVEERLFATNVGTVTLERVAVDLDAAGEDFVVTDDACTQQLLRPEESCAFTVVFRPDEPADARATLVVTSDELDAPRTATLRGTGVPAGPELVAVPDVAGMARDQAERTLRSAGLALDADPGPADARVKAQEPAAGELVDVGTPVAVTLVVGDPRTDELLWALAALLGLATVGITTRAHGRSRRWLRTHVRLDPHGAASIKATVDQPDRQLSAAIRFEPRADAGTQSLREVGR